jgi:hypothetical protein
MADNFSIFLQTLRAEPRDDFTTFLKTMRDTKPESVEAPLTVEAYREQISQRLLGYLRCGPRRPAELCEALDVCSETLAGVIETLKGQQLIESQGEGLQMQIRLTPFMDDALRVFTLAAETDTRRRQ